MSLNISFRRSSCFLRLLLLAFGILCECIALPLQASGQSAHGSLFSTDTILEFTLRGRLRDLFNDRDEHPGFHPITLAYAVPGATEVHLAIEAKTRGHFRRMRENCTLPPLLLQFNASTSKDSLFQGQKKLKLVMPCTDEELVIREYLVYRLYNILTPMSFKVRLAKVRFEDTARNKVQIHYCFLLEAADQMAHRNRMACAQQKMTPWSRVDFESFTLMAVFQYMIGNTDWSLPYLHNMELIRPDSSLTTYPVAYDFDHAGLVRAPYAAPAPELNLSSTIDRLYRGYCVSGEDKFAPVFERFNTAKGQIYAAVRSCPLLSASFMKTTLRYLDAFYETINNRKIATTEFLSPCQLAQHTEIRGF